MGVPAIITVELCYPAILWNPYICLSRIYCMDCRYRWTNNQASQY